MMTMMNACWKMCMLQSVYSRQVLAGFQWGKVTWMHLQFKEWPRIRISRKLKDET